MGNDTPLAVLSRPQPLLYSYFKQLFAQVTNPPIDSIREAVVMSVADERRLRAQPARRDARARAPARDRQADPARRRAREPAPGRLATSSRRTRSTSPGRSPTAPPGSSAAIERICAEADEALARRRNILILSDRGVGPERAPIPSLLATAAVHHHLVRAGTRLQAGLVVETGEPREVQHVATLIGYGAAAVNPYVMLETLAQLVDEGRLPATMTAEDAQKRAVKGDRARAC